MFGIIEKIFGNYSEKELKRVTSIIDKIESLDSTMINLSDDELKAKTNEFKQRYNDGQSLDSILPEAYAVVRETGKRVLGMKHFRVQLMGGIILHQGRIAEMRTGEGKTLVSTLPAYLNAISGKGVHVVTVNDYLAKRDAEWMGQIHEFLGLKVGIILSNMEKQERKEAYACDITYATNNELGFDYLRDNMAVFEDDTVQRELNYAVIDEVDSVLIDEARTPLIISGSSGKSTHLYQVANAFVKTITKGKILNEGEALNPLLREELKEEGDFIIDEKSKTCTLTQEGVVKSEKYFNIENLADPNNLELQHHINNALKAHYTMALDKDYVVQDDEIIIVDEFTGRLMDGRRYSDGLHQAIEAKEAVTVKKESKTLATVTFQNFFNKYIKKSGMTGTAQTEESEFREIYGMDVVRIPTNRPIQRIDHPDVVYKTEKGKLHALVEDVKKSYEKGQPVLIGTVTIEKSEEISALLKKEGVRNQVLNAKYHEKEAEIVELAGRKGVITIATNMAGRGTDIKLEDGVEEMGGLKIIGTERHESRRIDNQLRGRAGRQGDRGESKFYIALEDDLMRLFGGESLMKMFEKVNISEYEAIENKILTKSIENAQKKVEGNNFSIRKHLLEYDRVMNEQREIIYDERKKVLMGDDIHEKIYTMIKNVIIGQVDFYIGNEEYAEEWNLLGLNESFLAFNFGTITVSKEELETITRDELIEKTYCIAKEFYDRKANEIGEEHIRELERVILLRMVDQKWVEHLDNIEHIRQGISLIAYGQRDPIVEYKNLTHDMFDEMNYNIQFDTIKGLFNLQMETQIQMEQVSKSTSTNKDETLVKKPKIRAEIKIGRNDKCPCGSGKKYKLCCGK